MHNIQKNFFKQSKIKWIVILVVICIVIISAFVRSKIMQLEKTGPNTLIGAEEIYPTVMVNGQLYEWRRGKAIAESLPDNCEYYGEISHIEGEYPQNDGEFVSVFSASGQIYLVPGNDSSIYLYLTTDWMDDTAVIFDCVNY